MSQSNINLLNVHDDQERKTSFNFTPYDYQQEALNAIEGARNSGEKRALVHMATGLGKTWVAAFEAKKLLEEKPDARILFLAHQNDILSQNQHVFDDILGETITTGLFNGDVKDFQPVNCLFGSFRTMDAWKEAFMEDEFDYIIVDEGHHASADTFEPTIRYFTPDFLLGITATPDRHDARDIRSVFGKEVFSLPLEEALVRNYLTPVDYRLITDELQLESIIDTTIGKYSISKLNREIFIPRRDEEIAKIILDHSQEIAEPRRIVFCPSIEYVERFAPLVDGVALHSQLSNKNQKQIITSFKEGSINTILTIDMFNEGIDIPEANQIVFLRSTQSKTIFLQQLGRGLRKSDTKERVQVLDFAMNCERILMIRDLWEHMLASSSTMDGSELLVADLNGTISFNESTKDVIALLKKIGEGYTEDYLIHSLKELGTMLGKVPSLSDGKRAYKQGLIPAPDIFIHTFDNSWRKALQAAGYEVGLIAQSYTDDELLERIQQFHAAYGKLPFDQDEFNMYARQGKIPHKNTFRTRFGSWKNAVELAGFEYEGKYRTGIKTDDVIAAIQLIDSEIDTSAFGILDWQRELQKKRIGSGPIRRLFVNWNNALAIAGVSTIRAGKRNFDDDRIIRQLASHVDEQGRIPSDETLSALADEGLLDTPDVIKKRFGSLGNAAILASRINQLG